MFQIELLGVLSGSVSVAVTCGLFQWIVRKMAASLPATRLASLIAGESLMVIAEQERAIAELANDHFEIMESLPENGRLGATRREWQAEYERSKVEIVRQTEIKLQTLDRRAREAGLEHFVEKIVNTCAEQYPSVGLLNRTWGAH